MSSFKHDKSLALIYFASVVAHELAHSLVSKAHGVPVREITLYMFGGTAEIAEEPKRARDEFLIALAGPVTSLTIAVLFGFMWLVSLQYSQPLHALAGWLAWIYLGLGLFNLIPGFPLDGGRVLRATVWCITGNLKRATQVATSLGWIVAYGFIFWGIWQVFNGNWVNGLWIAFIGWFLSNAAMASSRRMALSEILTGHTVREVMMTDCPRINPDLPLDEVVESMVLPSGRRCFPVIDNENVLGLLTMQNIGRVPKEARTTTRVEQVMISRETFKTVHPDEELVVVFERMTSEDVNQLMVMDNEQLLGMVTRSNLLAFLRTSAKLGI
ncbi:MAG: site-2 protease family protein [Sedimenticola sp.]|nr:site-2 protease family protein [Sedimenticola sp.]